MPGSSISTSLPRNVSSPPASTRPIPISFRGCALQAAPRAPKAAFRAMTARLKKAGLNLSAEDSLKRAPRGFEAIEDPEVAAATRLKLRSVCARSLRGGDLASPALADDFCAFAADALPLLKWGLGRACRFALGPARPLDGRKGAARPSSFSGWAPAFGAGNRCSLRLPAAGFYGPCSIFRVLQTRARITPPSGARSNSSPSAIRDQPSIEAIAERYRRFRLPTSSTSSSALGRALTPKAFLQAITIERARELLRDSASVLDAALGDVGLLRPEPAARPVRRPRGLDPWRLPARRSEPRLWLPARLARSARRSWSQRRVAAWLGLGFVDDGRSRGGAGRHGAALAARAGWSGDELAT